MTAEIEIGMMQTQSHDWWKPPKARKGQGRTDTIYPEPQREQDPADTFILDLWPPEL